MRREECIRGERSEGIDALEEVVDVFFPTVVEETLAEVEGKALTVVARHAKLTLYLTLCGIELRGAQGLLHNALKLFHHKTAAAVDVVGVATEIDTPHTGVAIANHSAVNGINQSVTLAQREVEAGVHAWSSQYVVEQVESHAPLVVDAVGTVANHHMRLMRMPVNRHLMRIVGRQWGDYGSVANDGL